MAEEIKNIHIDVSVIIPAYNVEQYLSECIQSVLNQNCNIEIIIIDDGSTDNSFKIARSFEDRYENIILLHQSHSGPSIARNQGLSIAKGEYLAFIDSDDWIEKDSLSKIYDIAKAHELDMILGNMVYCYPQGKQYNIYNMMPEALKNKSMTGAECFTSLMKADIYYPMACGFVYKREWIRKNDFSFDENIIHEDEVWTQITLCLAPKVMLTDVDFYYYRKRVGSIMHTLDARFRIKCLFHVAFRFMKFSMRYSLSRKDKEIKSWIYVNTYRIYATAFTLLPKVRDSNFKLPNHGLYTFCLVYKEMLPDARIKCYKYYKVAKNALRAYHKWKLSPYNINIQRISEIELNQKKIIVIYNNPVWSTLKDLEPDNIPSNYIITTDRKYYSQACAVVFHLPDLFQNMEDDLEKLDNQLWVAWNMECDENYPWMKDQEIKDLFDIRMDYRQDADIVCSYMDAMCSEHAETYKEKFLDAKEILEKENKVCMIISSAVNKSKRIEYLQELMQYIEIDSYGELFNNKKIQNDKGRETKLELYSKYKFIIAFENAMGDDYVTEKFYDPLLVGSVPVYMGAPNVEEFAPGDHSYINAKDFESPQELAHYLKKCLEDKDEYMKYHNWKNAPLRKDYIEKVKVQTTSSFVRLCEFLNKR